nr:MAG TPA: hypothetical protein [Caudoviricetes sp.]
MTTYLRYDYINNNEIVETYTSLKELIQDTNEFYHETFKEEDTYNENFKAKTLNDAVTLFEANGFGIARTVQERNR